jgi:cell division protein ZapA
LNDKVQVEIFGTSYTLSGSADPVYTRSLASYVDKKMIDLSGKGKGMPLAKLAVLTAINVAHELFQLQNQQKAQRSFVDGKTRDLIESIEEQFDELRLD